MNAQWWRTEKDGRIRCYLCPRECRIRDGQNGFCIIRKNEGGCLISLAYGRPTALQIDPIEKKPLFHFYPGSRIFSLGTAGCNMGCSFCQNWDLSKSRADQRRSAALSPEAVVQTAVEHGCQALAFTYNEPTIWAEYVVDISKIARQSGIKTAMVTNGYISKDAFHDVYRYIDAANVDLKAFTESFYHKLTLSHLAPVLAALQRMRHESDVWIEITTLLIPSLNDKDEEIRQLSDWVLENLGADVPIHFTAFHPDYRLLDKPATPPETLRRARKTAKQSGVKFVYEGNIHSDGCNTYCPRCGHLLIRRSWHSVEEYHLKGNYCQCGEFIPGHFPDAGDTIQLGAGAIERLRRIFS